MTAWLLFVDTRKSADTWSSGSVRNGASGRYEVVTFRKTSGIFVRTIGGQSPPIATKTVRLTVKRPSLRERTRRWTVPFRTQGYVSVRRWPETYACVGSEAPTTRSADGVSGSLM